LRPLKQCFAVWVSGVVAIVLALVAIRQSETVSNVLLFAGYLWSKGFLLLLLQPDDQENPHDSERTRK
jgi:hypothetical protein